MYVRISQSYLYGHVRISHSYSYGADHEELPLSTLSCAHAGTGMHAYMAELKLFAMSKDSQKDSQTAFSWKKVVWPARLSSIIHIVDALDTCSIL